MPKNRASHHPFGAAIRPCAAVAALAIAAAPGPLFAVGHARDIRFTQISIEQGLSQSIVECIIQDRRGFIWMATEDGLNKFDGYDLFGSGPVQGFALTLMIGIAASMFSAIFITRFIFYLLTDSSKIKLNFG